MSHETLSEEVKVRVPETMKRELEELAVRRHLKAADLVREALRLYLQQNVKACTRAEEAAV